jgi:GNAT superfamily N-acetyltransferase
MIITTIRGAARHTAETQTHVDRAADVLPSVFGDDYASSETVRLALSDPANVLLAATNALAIVLGPGTEQQRFWLLWVDPAERGKGVGSALLGHIVAAYTQNHPMRLQCQAALEAFYGRQGFHTLYTVEGGAFCYMAGPAKSRADLLYLLPRALRS